MYAYTHMPTFNAMCMMRYHPKENPTATLNPKLLNPESVSDPLGRVPENRGLPHGAEMSEG